MELLTFLAKRFVAGETAADAVAVVRRMNARGIAGMVDFLGEHVTTAEEAADAVTEYLQLLDALHAAGVQASISLKASQMGVTVSPDVCLANLLTITQHAASFKINVWLDMEGSALTQKTIDVFERLRARHPNVGLCLQAALVRTGGDLDRLMRLPDRQASHPLRIRLCKGAYKEPASIAYTTKPSVDGSFRMLARKLIENIPRQVYPAFATHDSAMIRDILEDIKKLAVPPKTFEFQMLYGIQNSYLETLAAQGYPTQVYIPYGKAWLPYFMRRLRERKENVYFLMRNLFRM